MKTLHSKISIPDATSLAGKQEVQNEGRDTALFALVTSLYHRGLVKVEHLPELSTGRVIFTATITVPEVLNDQVHNKPNQPSLRLAKERPDSQTDCHQDRDEDLLNPVLSFEGNPNGYSPRFLQDLEDEQDREDQERERLEQDPEDDDPDAA